jgi:hypothetical protein
VDDSPYSFGPTPGLTADVQAWLERPDSSFGWILISTAEATPKTARRFGSREDPFNAPRLLVDYALPIRLESPSIAEGHFQFEFNTEPNQAYRVEKISALDPTGSWTTLTNVPPSPSPGRAIITDPLANSTGYCRVVAL